MMGFNNLAQQMIVLGQHVIHRPGILLPQFSAASYVGE
jgi:hypothetical protein